MKRFSAWVRWMDREKLENLEFPGVYAVAISEKGDLSGKDFSWIKEIIYVGMSNAVHGLKGRLKQFDNTIHGRGVTHNPAKRIHRDYPATEKLVPNLYVAVAAFECDVTSYKPADLRIMGDVCKAEYECWAQFADAFGRVPNYNYKKNAPK